MKLRCLRCGWKWNSRKKGRVKSCPGCHSTAWDRKRGAERPPVETEQLDMICTICKKDLLEGETIYRAQEGKNIDGVFIFTGEEKMQGLYCGGCMADPKDLPFINDM